VQKKANKCSVIVSCVVLILLTTLLPAQDVVIKDTKCVKKHDLLFDGFYGYPYFIGGSIKLFYEKQKNNLNPDNNYKLIEFKNRNHIGFKFEYLITPKIGVGFEYTYASLTLRYTQEESILGSNNINYFKKSEYQANLYKHRILGRVNYHFYTTEKFDSYAAFGIGFKTSQLNSNNIEDYPFVKLFNLGLSNIFPVSYRAGIGFRYFITNNIGLNGEFGLGGPIIQTGLTLKFHNNKATKKNE